VPPGYIGGSWCGEGWVPRKTFFGHSLCVVFRPVFFGIRLSLLLGRWTAGQWPLAGRAGFDRGRGRHAVAGAF
jgi:hypothetical protein